MIKYLQFSEEKFIIRYPMLFDMATSDVFNFNDLNYFLEMRDKIISDSMTFEDASKDVGKVWFDKHVDTSKLQKNKKHKS